VVFFSERAINVWKQLPESTDFSWLLLFIPNVQLLCMVYGLATCIYFINRVLIFAYMLGNLSAFCALLSSLMRDKDDDGLLLR